VSKGSKVNQYNTSFSHYFVPVFTNFRSHSSSFCCFVEKSIRVDLMRQGSQFRTNRSSNLFLLIFSVFFVLAFNPCHVRLATKATNVSF
jgi:hypothetical protein